VSGGSAKDVGEGGREGGGGLEGGVHVSANVAGHVETEDGFDLVGSDAFLDFEDVGEHVAHVIGVAEDKGFFDIETTGDNVFCVFYT